MSVFCLVDSNIAYTQCILTRHVILCSWHLYFDSLLLTFVFWLFPVVALYLPSVWRVEEGDFETPHEPFRSGELGQLQAMALVCWALGSCKGRFNSMLNTWNSQRWFSLHNICEYQCVSFCRHCSQLSALRQLHFSPHQCKSNDM